MSDHSYDKIIKAPGRICLFGEHQDYLGYPVIAGAINRYITIKGNKKSFLKNPEAQFIIHTPDLKNSNPKIYKKSQLSNKNILLDYKNERDYLSSSINVAKKNNLKWEEFWDINLTGNIPINAGASSSSAMVIGWLLFLYEIAGKKIDEKTLGELGYKAEVEEFDESGGMMDHFSSAIGNIIYVESTPKFKVTLIKELEKEEKNQEDKKESQYLNLNGFVLANSGVKKETVEDLKNTKTRALKGFHKIKEIFSDFNRFESEIKDVRPYLNEMKEDEALISEGNLQNRNITQEALDLLQNNDLKNIKNQKKLGHLLLDHHHILSKKIGVSIPLIDKMVNIAMDAGAYGAKINGSGFGGTMFAYAPQNTENVLNALRNEGYDCWIVDISKGAHVVK